jgi:hypothetical protein
MIDYYPSLIVTDTTAYVVDVFVSRDATSSL